MRYMWYLNHDIIARIWYFAKSVKSICWIYTSFGFVQIPRSFYLFFFLFFVPKSPPFPVYSSCLHTRKPNEMNHNVQRRVICRGFVTIHGRLSNISNKIRISFCDPRNYWWSTVCGIKCGIARQTSGALSNRMGLPIQPVNVYILVCNLICKQISRQYVIFGMREWILDMHAWCVCAYVSRIYFLPIDDTREIKLKCTWICFKNFWITSCKDFQIDISIM